MSLSVEKFPNIIFANSPCEVKFLRTGVADPTAGGFARLYLVLNELDPPTIGETLVLLQDTAAYLTFTFAATGGTNLQLATFNSGTFAAYCQELANDLYRNPTLKEEYTVKYLSYDAINQKAVILFTSRERGSAYNLTIDPDPATTLDYVVADTITETVTDEVALANYKVKIAVDALRDFMFNAIEKRVDNMEATGVVDYDTKTMEITLHELPPLAKSSLRYDIPFNAFLIQPYREACAMMMLEAHEEYTGSTSKAIVQTNQDINTNNVEVLAVLSGLPLRGMDFYGTYFGATYRNWSMWPGQSKLTTKQQAEWLSVSTNFGTEVTFTVHYSDATSATKVVTYATEVTQLIYIPTGFDQNLLAELNTTNKTEVRWTVQIVGIDQGTYDSFEYVIDQRYFREERCFVFFNALGVLETLRCVGVNKYTVIGKGATGSRALTEDTVMARGTIEMIYNESEEEWTMRTGWLMTQEEKEYLTDFLRSKYVAEITLPLYTPEETLSELDVLLGTEYFKEQIRAVVIAQESVEMWEDDNGRWALEFKMKFAHVEGNYTSLPAKKETWYDTVIEFIVEVEEVLAGSPYVQISVNPLKPVKVEYLNTELDWTSEQFPISNAKHYKLRLSCSGETVINIQANAITADIRFTKIETNVVNELFVGGFRYNLGDYFIKKLRYWWTLQILTIWSDDTPATLNKWFDSLIQLDRQVPGVMTDISFPFTVPNAVGEQQRDYLIAQGIAVVTG